MKKIISVLLAAVMACSLLGATAMAYAADTTVESPSGQTHFKPAEPRVSAGKGSVSYVQDEKDEYIVTFTVKAGEGESLKSWDIPGEEGKDYTVLAKEDNVLKIKVLNEKLFSTESVVAVMNVPSGEAETPVTPDESGKSPATGAMAGAAVAFLGAGAALTSVLKKKED